MPLPPEIQSATTDGSSLNIIFEDQLVEPVDLKTLEIGFELSTIGKKGSTIHSFNPAASNFFSYISGPNITSVLLSIDVYPLIETSDQVFLKYDTPPGDIQWVGGVLNLDSFSPEAIDNTSINEIGIDDAIISSGDEPPWLRTEKHVHIDHTKIIVIANTNNTFPLSVLTQYSGDTWPVALAKFYCDERSIPQSNILFFDLGNNPHSVNPSNTPNDEAWYSEVFCVQIEALMSSISAQAILLAPGCPWQILHDTRVDDLEGSVRTGNLCELAGMARYIVDNAAGRTIVAEAAIQGSTGWVWDDIVFTKIPEGVYDVTKKLTGVDGAFQTRSIWVLPREPGLIFKYDRMITPSIMALLGATSNVILPFGRVGIASNGNISGGNDYITAQRTIRPDGKLTEDEKLSFNIISKASKVMKMNSSQQRFWAFRSLILVHIYATSGTNLGAFNTYSCIYSALKSWGFNVKYWWRTINAPDAFSQVNEHETPVSVSDYFPDKVDALRGGMFFDIDNNNQALDVPVATHIGNIGNDDFYNEPWKSTYAKALTDYQGFMISMFPSFGYRMGEHMESRGAFAWCTAGSHKGGGSEMANTSVVLANLLVGSSLLEASFALDHADMVLDVVPVGDPLWQPYLFLREKSILLGDELNDVKYAALKATAGVPVTDNDHMADMYYRWLILNGGTGAPDATIQDLEYTMLASQGATIPSTLNDMWWQVLVAGGYGTVDVDQQLNDMLLKFWLAGGIFTVVFPVILDMEALAHFMTNEGWTIIDQTLNSLTIDFGPGYVVPRAFMESCNFAGYPAPIRNDLRDGVQLQGFCI